MRCLPSPYHLESDSDSLVYVTASGRHVDGARGILILSLGPTQYRVWRASGPDPVRKRLEKSQLSTNSWCNLFFRNSQETLGSGSTFPSQSSRLA